MKAKLFLLFFLSVNLTYCQNNDYDKKIVEEVSSVSVLEAPFMINELIEIYQTDTTIIEKTFNKKIFDRTKYTLYCYNVCADTFKNRLIEKINNDNKQTIEKMISELDYDKNFIKPQINWGKIFETCQTCPFGEYPDEMIFYFKFSILFMDKEEVQEMINKEEGSQWKYVLEDIKHGDAFTLSEDNYVQYVLDRRMASYIIKRWSKSEIPEVQRLLDIYKSIM